MSVKIFYNACYRDYCPKTSLKEQLEGAKKVEISAQDDGGTSARNFLENLENETKLNLVKPIEIDVKRDNSIISARIARSVKTMKKEILADWLVHQIVWCHMSIDKKIDRLLIDIEESCHAKEKT